MTSKELCEAINTSLYLPIPEELGERLIAIINAMIPDIEMKDVQACSCAFFRNEVSLPFKEKFQGQYKDTYGDDLLLPNIAFEVLETCQLLAFLNSDNIDNQLKAKASLVVRNNAIWRKGNWKDILCPLWIEKMYAYYPKYGTQGVIKYTNYDSLLKGIVPYSTIDDLNLDLNDQNVYNQLRSLCKSILEEQVRNFTRTSDFKDIDSPFTQVYWLVSKMVVEWQWKYIDASPVRRIVAAMGDKVKKRKTLCKIVSDLKKESQFGVVSPRHKSSVLLFRLSEDKNTELDGQQFSVLEFGVYLYYELLLEYYTD